MSVEGGITAQEAHLLYTAAQTVKDGCIVEVGSCLGRSTAALALGTRAGFYVPVYAIDPSRGFSRDFGPNLRLGPSDRTAFHAEYVASRSHRNRPPGQSKQRIHNRILADAVALLWIDGDHRYKAVKRDVACWLPHLRPTQRLFFTMRPIHKLVPYTSSKNFSPRGSGSAASRSIRRSHCTADCIDPVRVAAPGNLSRSAALRATAAPVPLC